MIEQQAVAGEEGNDRSGGRAERSAANRRALIRSAREEFGAHGYQAVGTAKIVAGAGLTLGALYHHFSGKSDLFLVVLDQVETAVMEGVAAVLNDRSTPDPLARLSAGVDAWVDALADPQVRQIVLMDSPTVLGPQRRRGSYQNLQMISAALEEVGGTRTCLRQSSVPLAHLIVAVVEAATHYIATARDPRKAREEIAPGLHHLVSSLALPLPALPPTTRCPEN